MILNPFKTDTMGSGEARKWMNQKESYTTSEPTSTPSIATIRQSDMHIFDHRAEQFIPISSVENPLDLSEHSPDYDIISSQDHRGSAPLGGGGQIRTPPRRARYTSEHTNQSRLRPKDIWIRPPSFTLWVWASILRSPLASGHIVVSHLLCPPPHATPLTAPIFNPSTPARPAA